MHYTALDTTKNEIRLLHLAPSSNRRKKVACHFSIVSLNAREQFTHYEALSYAWGVPVFDRSIDLEGANFPITANLHLALRALRYADRERILWIDAVCIDQTNVKERSHQVSRMNDIYSRASNVVVWLGEPRTDAAFAFDFLTEFGHCRTERPPLLQTERNAEQTAMSVRSFMTRSWWTRIWTAQEWILANSSTFQSGQYLLKGEVLLRCLEHCRRHVKSADCCYMELKSDFLFNLEDSLQPMFALHSVRRSYAGEDFSYSLGFLRMRQATDPRDKVYGVLALAANRYAGLLRVDYDLSVEEAYEQLTVALIKRTGHLDILSHVAPNQLQNLDVPSFVPDWTIELGKEYSTDWTERFRNRHKYNACLNHVADFTVAPRTLHIKGVLVDTIATMATRRLGSYLKTRSYRNELLDEMFKIAKPIEEGYYHGQRQTRKEAFWLTMCGGLEESSDRATPISERRLTHFQIFQSWEHWFRGPRTSYQTSDLQLRTVTDRVSSVSKGRTFFITEQGRMGWAPKNSMPGDVIAVLTGGRVPIVLRPNQGCYAVVGDAYVHGVMDGEAMVEADDLEYLELH
ncbi:hypothetical protein M3J09_007874 [Ascochyta lentis]